TPQPARGPGTPDTAAAPAIRSGVGETPDRVQLKSSHESHMHPWRLLVVEALPHHAFSQNVQRLQLPHLSPVSHDQRFFDPCKIANLNLVRRRLGQDCPGKTRRRRVNCSVTNGGEKKDPRCRKAKPSRPSARPPLRMITLCRPSPSAAQTSAHSLKPRLCISRLANYAPAPVLHDRTGTP